MIEEIHKSALPSNPTGAPKFLSAIYLVALVAIGTLALALLIHDGKKLGIPLALLTCAGIMFAGRAVSRRASDSASGIAPSIHLLPALVIGLVTFAIYVPTLHIYFLTDDFGCLHAFHQPSLHQFLAMFHTDLAQVVEGETGQEIRPFYALFFMMGYKFFGLHPFGYHLVEILLHVLNALLVYCIANVISRGKPWRACVAALFFSVHPAHAGAVSWITGAPAELIHTFFYLGAFLFFVLFRSTNKRHYLALTVAGFAACLVSKEMTVTLPLMLLAYDVFRNFALRSDDRPEISARTERQATQQLLTYTPFVLLLIVYFAWRRHVFSHVLGENFWAESLGMGASGSGLGLFRPLHAAMSVIRYLLSHHAENLRNLLLASPAMTAGIALGIVAAFAIGLWRRSQDDRTIAWVVFFGLVWYVIADLPLLVASFEPRHLYLVAAGPCIATAFLICPEHRTAQDRLADLRFAAAAVLIGIFAAQLWSDNSKIRRQGEVSAATVAQIVELGPTLSPQAIILIPIRQPGLLPFSLQVPFASSDVYSRLPVVEYPDMCDCPFPRWKEKTRRILEAVAADPKHDPVEMELLAWNERTQSVDLGKTRVASSAAIRDAVVESTGGPPDALGSIDARAGTRLMDALVRISSGEK